MTYFFKFNECTVEFLTRRFGRQKCLLQMQTINIIYKYLEPVTTQILSKILSAFKITNKTTNKTIKKE